MITIRTFGMLIVVTLATLAQAADTDKPKPKYGPHGGDLRSAEDHHAELSLYNGQIELYLYKPDGKSPLAIRATRLTAAVTIPGKQGQRRVTLSAKPQADDEKGHSSRFVATAAYLKQVKQIEAMVGFAVGRKPHRVTFTTENRKPVEGGRRRTVTFYGVEFEISVSTPQAVLDRLSMRMDKAVKDENAGNLQSALKQMRELRADLPDDVTSVGLDAAITRVESKIKTGSVAKDIDKRIAAAIELANMDKHAEALAALKQIKADLPKDVKAPGLDAAIAEIEKKLAEKK